MRIDKSTAFQALDNALAERPPNYARVREATKAFVRSQRHHGTPELVIGAVKSAFERLVQTDPTPGVQALRDQALRWVIEECYRGRRD